MTQLDVTALIGCQHPVYWAVTSRGTPIPLDRGPHPDGGVAVFVTPHELPPVVRHLRRDVALVGTEVRRMVHYQSHPECRPARAPRGSVRR